MPREGKFTSRLGIQILASVVEDCTCPECDRQSNICSIEIIGLLILAGVHLTITIIFLLSIMFGSQFPLQQHELDQEDLHSEYDQVEQVEEEEIVGEEEEGGEEEESNHYVSREEVRQSYPLQSTPLSRSSFQGARNIHVPNVSLPVFSGRVEDPEEHLLRSVSPADRVSNNSIDYYNRSHNALFPGHNTPASSGGSSCEYLACPRIINVSQREGHRSASGSPTSQPTHYPLLQPVEYWL